VRWDHLTVRGTTSLLSIVSYATSANLIRRGSGFRRRSTTWDPPIRGRELEAVTAELSGEASTVVDLSVRSCDLEGCGAGLMRWRSRADREVRRPGCPSFEAVQRLYLTVCSIGRERRRLAPLSLRNTGLCNS